MKKIMILILFVNLLFAETVDMVSGESVSGNVLKNQLKEYKIHADAGQTLEVLMNELTEDGDLYVKIGSKATTNSFDCRSIRSSTHSEKCSLSLATASDVFITVFGYRATDYVLKASLTNGNHEIVTLSSGTAISSHINKGDTKYYKISASKNSSVESVLDGLDNDADLYVKVGSQATASSYDCRSTNSNTNIDSCSLFLNSQSDLFISVYGYRSTDFTITATEKKGAKDEVIELNSGEAVRGSVAKGKTVYYKIAGESGERVTSLIDNLTADADIYMKIGSKPTGGSFDCKSTNGGKIDDSCSKVLVDDAEIFLGVYGYRAADFQITATLKDANTEVEEIALISDESDVGTVGRDSINYYTIEVGDKQTVSIVLDQLNADIDMYVQVDSKPTTDIHACQSTRGANNAEECTFSLQKAGTVYIGVYGFRASDYRVKATVTNTIVGEKIIEDAEGGAISPNWIVLKGNYTPEYYPRPDLPNAPEGTGVIAFPLDSSVGQVEYYTSYALMTNDSIHKILEVDLGGLPDRNDAYFEAKNVSSPGVIIHYALGVEVDTLDGTRRMNWDSFFTHHNTGAHFGTGNWLDYPSPVEMTRVGGSKSLWNHFKVDLEKELKKLEPNNRIIKVNYFFTLGGAMDNIKLVSE